MAKVTVVFSDGEKLVKEVADTPCSILNYERTRTIICNNGEAITVNLDEVKYISFLTDNKEDK